MLPFALPCFGLFCLNYDVTYIHECMQDIRAVMEKKERMREKELANIQQKKRLDKLKQQVHSCKHMYIVCVQKL